MRDRPTLEYVGKVPAEVSVFCPQCKAEYRFGFARCSDCDVKLVALLPVVPPPNVDTAELVIIRTYSSVIEADLAKNALGAAGIEAELRSDGGIRRNYFALDLQGVDLFVRADDAEDAQEILGS